MNDRIFKLITAILLLLAFTAAAQDEELLEAAMHGNAEAQFQLGNTYYEGKGAAKDYQKALIWYLRAATHGHPQAQYQLGVIYDQGLGTPQSYMESMKWFRLAAEQGSAEAQYRLGHNHCVGHGVPRDLVQCYAWLNVAAAQGSDKAVKMRVFAINNMSSEELMQAQELSMELWTQHGPAREWQPEANMDIYLEPIPSSGNGGQP